MDINSAGSLQIPPKMARTGMPGVLNRSAKQVPLNRLKRRQKKQAKIQNPSVSLLVGNGGSKRKDQQRARRLKFQQARVEESFKSGLVTADDVDAVMADALSKKK